MFSSNALSVYALKPGNSSSVAPLARLEDWRFYPEASQLEISLSAASQPKSFYLAQPPRIVIDLPGTKLGNIPTQQNFSGAIRSIRVAQLNADVTRIVMDLAPGTLVDPNQVQLQPVSRASLNRWVLRPLVASNRTFFPQGNLPPLPGNFSPTTMTSPQPSNTPPSIYNNPPQPPGNFPPGTYNNPPQAPVNLPSATYNSPQPPGNFPPGTYNNPPQPPANLPSATYNPPQVPNFSVPPPLTTTPATTNNFPQAPSVRVPPLTPSNPSQLPSSVLPAPSFPSQRSNIDNSIPPVGASNFPVPTAPSSPPSSPNSRVIEFGQPFPNPRR
ncbi:hypothetical protein BZZ01_30330 [Nostocales cyanobacterium HT-58-2]|nr:hypothetical protein BZZ01_30330 [Nostocales cyanobacterium HT-58-2]